MNSLMRLSIICTFSYFGLQVPVQAALTKLTAEDRACLLETCDFKTVIHLQDLPKAVLEQFYSLTKDSKPADAGRPYQETDDVEDESLPQRRFILGELSKNRCAIFYETGGYSHSYYVVLFSLTHYRAHFIWGAVGSKKLSDRNDLRDAITHHLLDDEKPFY